ncbi:MAG TPA: SAM-dependent chlorinase/fluorinase [Pyrinomonadaceae bacterium]|nr:SAM-dependent chlorinase/fluorinase [Pyrinomonadaceae bacterium]
MITLLTDFGTADYFVGAMKGVILTINPDASLVDITHEIAPQNILSGAFTLSAVYKNFPEGTIHVAVVDPGVGSHRRAIVVSARKQYFVGPDNGLFSFIFDEGKEARVFHATNEDYFHHPVSNTFHGRDIFAPVAAALSKGIRPEKLGPEITDYIRLPNLKPNLIGAGKLEASIIHIDRFGNCITNLTRRYITDEWIARGLTLTVNGRKITSFRRFFAEETDASDNLFAIWGSAGYLEIASNRASAAEILRARTGQQILVMRTE